MLARVGGGKSGIGEYLETGRKKGRVNGRDEVDERLVFEGDIEKLESVIATHGGADDADRYVHITLGFAEKFTAAVVCGPGEVNFEVMREAAATYRSQLMAAYSQDEYYWYAEAHIPKVTHDVHAVTGEAIERLPHIHIVFPKINLVDRTYLNPANTGAKNERYLQAIQETVNSKLGLKSPQDAKRAAAEAPLARHSSDFAKLSGTQIREELRQGVESGRIPSFDQLLIESEKYGAVRVRQGKQGDYINIAPVGAPKGINIKEFTRQDFNVQAGNAVSGQSRVAEFAKVAQEWTDKGAFEARYAVGGFHAQYQAFTGHEKAAWLQERIARTQAKLANARGDDEPQSITYREKIDEPGNEQRERADRRGTSAIYESNLHKSERLLQADSIDGVQHLSSVGMVHDLGGGEVLLHNDAPDHMGETITGDRALRRERGCVGRESGESRDPGGARSGLKRTVISTLDGQRQPRLPSAAQLKNDTNASLVLEAAVGLYQLDPSQYSVTSGQDGTPRILHADKQYNLGDFFTKHIAVPWSEAQQVLTGCYYQTLAEALPAPEVSLWQGFREWERVVKQDTGATFGTEFAKHRAEITDIRNEFKATRAAVRDMPASPKGRPKAGVKIDMRLRKSSLMAQARAQQIVKIAAAELRHEQARQTIKPKESRNALYRHYLTELAGKGSTSALKELRRSSKPAPDMDRTVTGPASKPVFPQPNYSVDHTGTVMYFKNAESAINRDSALVTDSTKGVAVVRVDPAAYVIALKVAVARYGPTLTLTGDAEFMKGMADAAKSQKISVTLKNSATPQAKPVVINPKSQEIGGR